MYYIKEVGPEKRNAVFADYIFKSYKGKTEEESVIKFVDAVFAKSIFTDKARMDAFLAKPNKKVLDKDPLFAYVQGVFGDLFGVRKK